MIGAVIAAVGVRALLVLAAVQQHLQWLRDHVPVYGPWLQVDQPVRVWLAIGTRLSAPLTPLSCPCSAVPTTWLLNGLAADQLGNDQGAFVYPPEPTVNTVSEFLSTVFGYTYSFHWWTILIIVRDLWVDGFPDVTCYSC